MPSSFLSRCRAVAVALAGVVVASSCSQPDQVSAPRARPGGASRNDVPGPGVVTLAKISTGVGTFNFHASVTGGGDLYFGAGVDRTIDIPTIQRGQEGVSTNLATPVNPDTWPAGSAATLTVCEVNIPAGFFLDRIGVTINGVHSTVTGNNCATVQVHFDDIIDFQFDNSNNGPVCTDQSATNYGGPLPCVYPPPPGKTFTIGPSSMEGHLKIDAGDWFNGGYSFKFKKNVHVATQFTVTAKVEVPVTCPNGGGAGGTIVIDLGTKVYNVPANNTDWLPTGDANSILSWMGAVVTPNLCGGFTMDNARGAIFTATVSQNPPTGVLVDFRFKYRDPAAKGKPNTNCTNAADPNRNKADVCGASWSQTVTDP